MVSNCCFDCLLQLTLLDPTWPTSINLTCTQTRPHTCWDRHRMLQGGILYTVCSCCCECGYCNALAADCVFSTGKKTTYGSCTHEQTDTACVELLLQMSSMLSHVAVASAGKALELPSILFPEWLVGCAAHSSAYP